MAKYIISQQASYDLDDIADYTIQAFGFTQAASYADGLKTCFESLAQFNKRGRAANELAPKFASRGISVTYDILSDQRTKHSDCADLHQSQDARKHL